MKEFEELQNAWNQQDTKGSLPLADDIIVKANTQTKKMTAFHLSTMMILTMTVLVLIWFFLTLDFQEISQPLVGILMMILSLSSRIIIEFISLKKFKKVNILSDFNTYTQDITRFYAFRKMLQFRITPLSIACYYIGFVLLIPTFKQTLSNGFYLYVLSSGFLFLIFITWIIIRQVKQELSILDFLKSISNTTMDK
jgi:hypothetical protein